MIPPTNFQLKLNKSTRYIPDIGNCLLNVENSFHGQTDVWIYPYDNIPLKNHVLRIRFIWRTNSVIIRRCVRGKGHTGNDILLHSVRDYDFKTESGFVGSLLVHIEKLKKSNII
jgi:hypothetical protein